nr:hypothetical protein [Tanacetum cinerariifolium]
MKKACYNCGGVDHLSYDCGKWVDHERSWAKNNNTHRNRSPRTVIHKPKRSPMRTTRPNMNDAQPKRTSFINQQIHMLKGLFKENQQLELNLEFQGFPLFVAAAQDKLILLDQRDKIGRLSEDKNKKRFKKYRSG